MPRLQILLTLLLLAPLNFYFAFAAPVNNTIESTLSKVEAAESLLETRSDHDHARMTKLGVEWNADMYKHEMKTLPVYEGPYCVERPESRKCTFASRLSPDQKVAEWIAYDWFCGVVGHWGNNVVPGHNMGFFSSLPGTIWVTQDSNSVAPGIRYESPRGKYTDVGRPFCYNAGNVDGDPSFRLACRIEFDCPPKQ